MIKDPKRKNSHNILKYLLEIEKQAYMRHSKRKKWNNIPKYLLEVSVWIQKQFNAKPTKKAQRQAQFRSSKMIKKKRQEASMLPFVHMGMLKLLEMI